jgi:hypothetical protein
MVVIDSQCQPGIALKEFIRYVGKRSAIPIAGVLGRFRYLINFFKDMYW